ncbi:MAG: methyltransferase domain-containing protein [Anaerolineae bacterium]|nr:methyltransferase domain-containing protein [Anaerolineae bacterium]
MSTPFFALTTRGLEPVVAAELAAMDGVSLHEQAYRRVHAVMDGDLRLLAVIRTADDVFLEVAAWEQIRHTRDMLPEFTDLSAALELQAAMDHLQTVRPLPQPVSFSVTANFVGKRNYNYHEIKAAVSTGVLQRYPEWTYADDDQDARLNVRVFIEHEHALVGVRLTETPLHRRSYKQQSLEGSLKPPVAAAMIQLAGLRAGQTLLDPFCGSGTILIEAAQQGLIAIGGDVNRQALQISQENAVHAQKQLLLAQWQAQHLPLADQSAAAVVSNLPWGKQVKVDDSLRTLYHCAYEEMQRVVVSGGVLVLLTTLPELIPAAPEQSFEISVYGQNPQVMIFRP